MLGLMAALKYPAEKQEQAKSLYHESSYSDQILIRSSIAHALEDCPSMLESHGPDWMLCTLCKRERPSDETMRVFQSLLRFVYEPIDLYLIEVGNTPRFKPMEDVADTCLIGVGLFKDYIANRSSRHGSPSPKWYADAGRLAFARSGHDDVAAEFDQWTGFIETNFS